MQTDSSVQFRAFSAQQKVVLGVIKLKKETLSVGYRDWQMESDEFLFLLLASRQSRLLVKRDWSAWTGIPYTTLEGVADFHVAGRHTHITRLLCNGARLPEAVKLARYFDIKMTRKTPTSESMLRRKRWQPY